jgi:hypothetical protein
MNSIFRKCLNCHRDIKPGLILILNWHIIPYSLKKYLGNYQGLINVDNPEKFIIENYLPQLSITGNVTSVIRMETVKFLKNLKWCQNPHDDLKRHLVSLASKYGYLGIPEIPIWTYRWGRIDLAWKKNNKIFLAIEIDLLIVENLLKNY